MSKELIEELNEQVLTYDEWAREKCTEKLAIDRIEELERTCQDHGEIQAALCKQIDDLRVDYHRACKAVSEMHAAAMGAAVGPVRGVVEDVADLKAERDALLADNARLRKLLEYVYKYVSCYLNEDISKALAATPGQSLTSYRNSALEEAAKRCQNDESGRDGGGYFAEIIRAMKEPE